MAKNKLARSGQSLHQAVAEDIGTRILRGERALRYAGFCRIPTRSSTVACVCCAATAFPRERRDALRSYPVALNAATPAKVRIMPNHRSGAICSLKMSHTSRMANTPAAEAVTIASSG
jgi:hypothetical protein